MNITFNKVKVTNFFSFGDAEVELDRGGYVLVSGVNENPVDNAVSNGSGKSSLFDAIIWCLTGSTIRECKNVSNINADNGAKVTLYFTVDSDSYEVTRTKDHKPLGTVLKIIRNNEDISGKGIRDTEKILQEYLPDLTAQFLGSVIILGQGLPQRFSNNTPSGRKEVLEKLSQSDFMINELTGKVNSRKMFLSAALSEVKNNISYLLGQKKVREESIESSKRALKSLLDFKPDAQSYLQDCDSQLAKVKETFEDVQGRYDSQLKLVDGILNAVNEQKSLLVDISTKKLMEENSIRSTYDPKLYQLNSDIDRLQSHIGELSKISDVCPTCGQKLQNVEKPNIKPFEDELQQKCLEKDSLLRKKRLALDELSTTYGNQEALIRTELDKTVQEKDSYTTSLNSLRQKVSNTQHEVITAERVYNEALAKINNLDTDIQEKQDAISQSTDVLNELETKILYNINEQKDMEERLSVLSKMSTALKRDFRGYLLTNVIDYISKRAKYYSFQVFGNDNIGFSLEGNAIEISFDGKEYSNLSGGEKQRIDLIIQLSIRDMLCCFMGFSSNILVLDEFVDGLDSVGCEQVLSLIAKNLSDVGTVYIITHHSSIAIPTDEEIVIVKGPDKISRIRQ